MKFKLGQFVKYELNDGFKVEGVVIGISKSFNEYLITPLKMSHPDSWKIGTREMMTRDEKLDEYFGRPSFGYIRTKDKCLGVGLRSKKLTSGEVQYDPNQMVDEEDDL